MVVLFYLMGTMIFESIEGPRMVENETFLIAFHEINFLSSTWVVKCIESGHTH